MNKMLKGALWLVAILIILMLIVFLPSRNEKSNTIKIGYFGPFTGAVAATTGEDIGNGFKLAAMERNMVGNKKVEVIYEDDACDPKKAVSAATKLLDVDHVDILVNGVCSGSMLSVAPLAEQRKVILFTPVSTSPKITDAGDYVFRTSASAIAAGQAFTNYIKSSGFKKVGILFESVEYPVGVRDALLKELKNVPDASVVAMEGVGSKDTDFRTPLVKINNEKPDVLVLILNSTVTANPAINQVRALGIKTPILGNEYFTYKDVLSNPSAEGVLATLYKYDQNSPAIQFLRDKYQSTYNKQPSVEIYSALAYDGYNVLLNAMEKCNGANSDCLKSELYKVKDYKGLSGNISIDSNGDTEREFHLLKIQGGKLIDVN